MRMENGSITVFLSLSLTIMLALIFTTIENARVSGLNTQLDLAADSAMDSLFALYDRQLMEKYGLLFLNGSGGNTEYSDLYLKNELQECIQYELNPKRNNSLSGITIYPMKLEEIRILDTVRATDFGGSVLEQEIVDYMKYKEVGNITDKLFGWKEVVEKGGSEQERIQDAEKTLSEATWENGTITNQAMIKPLEHNIIKEANHSEEGTMESQPEFDSERYKESIEKSVIHQAEEVKKNGFWKLIIPSGISLSAIKIQKETLPSATSVTQMQWENKNLAEEAARMVLYGEYVLEYCSNFTLNKEKSGIQYETEYILFGKESDDENLKTCVNRLLWIREGLNAAHIFASASKMESALTLATAIVGWTMIPALVTAAQFVIVGVWAYAESLLDVRRLLNGKKVALVKTEQNWQLGIEGLTDFFNGIKQEEVEDEDGIFYEDYIRILLLMMNKTEKYYRTMDVIQQNMRQISPDFEMQNYVYAAEICVEATANQLFLMIPIVRNTMNQRQYRIVTAIGRSY